MVAVIAGNGLGLSTGSASMLGASGQLGSALTGRGGDTAYVNAKNGNLIIDRKSVV
jgi:hypothetical protein